MAESAARRETTGKLGNVSVLASGLPPYRTVPPADRAVMASLAFCAFHVQPALAIAHAGGMV